MREPRLWVMMIACGVVLTGIRTAEAYYIDTGYISFRQPNGTVFEGREWGDFFERNFVTQTGYVCPK